MRNRENGFEIVDAFYIVISVLAIGLFITMATVSVIAVHTHKQVTFTVSKSERVVNSSGEGARYLVYTNKGVYENTDSFWNGKWNSSDLYNQIQVGKKYSCDTTGWRNGFFSWYPNLISCEEQK
jgi:hypothetical protein